MKYRVPPREPHRIQFTPSQTEPLWTVEEVAHYLRLKQETVRMMARGNKIPAIKVGKAWRFRSSDLKEMLNINPEIEE